jgi:aminoglycoside phosphotransferase (APT) family kinase protein
LAREPGEFIASGRTAEVHAWGAGWVLKLFREGIDTAVVRHEHGIAGALAKVGAPAPKVGEIVSIGSRYGIEYERIEGISLLQAMRANPSKLSYFADLMADVQLQINSIENVVGIPAQRTTIEQFLSATNGLDSETRRHVLARLKELAQGTSLCHGDFHPENIILAGNKATVLDWTVANLGDVTGDVARTGVILSGYLETMRARQAEATAIHQFIQRYLFRYQQSGRFSAEKYRDWIPIVAAARLSEGIEEQREWLIAQARSAFGEQLN